MSDTLREAAEKLADRFDEFASTASYYGTEREMDAWLAAATNLRTILAAHPADTETVTEWGVMYEDDLITKVLDEESAHLRKAVSIVKNTVIVTRTIGPWQVSK